MGVGKRPSTLRRSRLQAAEDGAEVARGDRDAGAIGDDLAGEGGEARTGEEDADEVQRVRRINDAGLRFIRFATHGAKRFHRLGERELLAHQSRHEPPAADLSPLASSRW